MTFKPLDEKAIFKVACQITSPQARADYLRQVCGDDEALHDRVAVLLKEHEDHPSFLEVPPAAFSPTLDMPAEPPTREGPGAQIGTFKLLEQIGEGGFGIVYMAEQQHPVRRKVALKVLKPGMDTRQVIARFEAERQALALMDHPHIAKVLDAGATESGRPYFVMELVRGMPITEYCDAHQLTPRERLELFVPVCHAVQHAHQKGIIHRDIKPSNVLVTKHDGMPVVKVIDFGVAKALGQQLTDKTLFTGFAQMIGTPLYMSPEQAELSGLDIDTRTDIYSLGVLLYELLTGTTPFDKERLKSAAFDEIRRMIREEEPPKPSTRLSELSRSDLPSRTSDTEGAASRTGPARQAGPTSLASIAALRKTEPRKLSQLVRGDLDWIVMKALEKDRNRRYETANGFALDIQRYLFDEPVAACPPSAAYRLRKFARRNKGSFAVGATVTVALLVSVVALAVSNALVRKESNEKQMALDAKGRALRDKDEALGEKEKALQQKGQALIDKGNALQTAETERNNAAANAKEAKTQEKLARRRFYAAQMNLAQQALEKGNTARVLELLENHRPRFDEEDLRGFEWYYLWGKCHRGLRTWLKTDSPPTAIAFAPDGRTMAIAGDDREVTLADAESGAAIGRLLLRDGELLKFFWEGGEALMFPFDGKALSFSRNGRELAVATTRGIQLWDWKEQEFLATLGHAVPIAEVVFFPDGKLLASVSSAGRLGRISIWDVEQRELVTTLPATEVWHVAIASDGTRLAAGGNRYVSVWLRDGRSWTKVRTHENLVHEVTSIAFSPDGVLLAAAALDNSADSSQVERIEPIDAGAGAAAAPVAPEKLVSGRPSHSGVYVWDVETGKEWVGLKGRGVVGWIGTIAFTPDSRFLAVSNHRTVLFYDLLSGLPQITTYGSPTHTGTVEHARFSPDGRFLVTAAASENIVKIWDSTAPAAPEILTVAGGSKFVSFSRDEQTLLAGSSIVKFWDLPSGREARSWALEEGESVTSALSSDGRLIATNHPDKTVKVTDVATGAEVARTAPLKRPPAYRVLFSPDVQTFAVAALETLPVWDIPGNKLLFTAPAQHYAYVIAFAPDGKRLGAAMLGGTVNVFDARTGALLKSIAAGSSWTTALAFSPDSRLLATANSDGTLKLWNPDDGTLQGSLRGHGDVVTLVNFFDDGQTVVSGTQDGAVRLWDMTTGQELLTFHDHQSMVNGAVVKRDGSLLATNSVDGQVRLRHALRPSEATAPRTELDPEDPLSPARQLDAADQFWAAGADEQAMAACESARVRLEVLVERFPQVRDYGRELARSWLVASLIEGSPAATGEPGEALRRAVDLYQHVPDGNQKSLVDKYSSLGQSLLARGEHDRPEQLYKHLVAFFEQLATADPNVPQYRLRAAVVEGRLAGLFAEVKQLPEAIAACKRASDLLQALSEDFPAAERGRSELVDAWSRIGSVRRSCQKIPDAVAAYSRTVDVQPDSPNVWWNRAYTYADANEHEKALHDYSKSIELDPSQWAAWNNRGVCYHRLGQMELAAADFSRAAELEPRGATQARQNLARTRVALGQLDLALAEFSRAIDAHPGSAGPLWTERGAIHAHFQRWAEAAADYSKAVELQPNNVPTLMSLVGALFLSGKKDEAVGWYRKVIELDPKDAVTCNNVGGMLLLLENSTRPAPGLKRRSISIRKGLSSTGTWGTSRRNRVQPKKPSAATSGPSSSI